MKGLSLEQVDRMLEESTPRTSAKWVPHSTFAAEMGLAGKEEQIHVHAEKGDSTEETDGAPKEVV